MWPYVQTYIHTYVRLYVCLSVCLSLCMYRDVRWYATDEGLWGTLGHGWLRLVLDFYMAYSVWRMAYGVWGWLVFNIWQQLSKKKNLKEFRRDIDSTLQDGAAQLPQSPSKSCNVFVLIVIATWGTWGPFQFLLLLFCFCFCFFGKLPSCSFAYLCQRTEPVTLKSKQKLKKKRKGISLKYKNFENYYLIFYSNGYFGFCLAFKHPWNARQIDFISKPDVGY